MEGSTIMNDYVVTIQINKEEKKIMKLPTLDFVLFMMEGMVKTAFTNELSPVRKGNDEFHG